MHLVGGYEGGGGSVVVGSFAPRQWLETVGGEEVLLAQVAEAGRRKSEEYSVSRVADRFIADFSSLIQN